MDEIWIRVNSRFSVSNLGRVINNKRNAIVEQQTIKIKNQAYKIYQVIAMVFPEICGYWFDGCVVHHKDFNHFNNIAENLQVLTLEEHIKIHHTGVKRSKETCKNIRKSLTGRRNTFKHVPIMQYTLNGQFVKEWDCISDVKELGYSAGNICYACQGKLKTAYGFKWKYKKDGTE